MTRVELEMRPLQTHQLGYSVNRIGNIENSVPSLQKIG